MIQFTHVTKVIDNTYHAELIIQQDGNMVSIDARPSDSIAIALRAKAPIYANDELLEQAAIEIQPSDLEWGDGPEIGAPPEGKPSDMDPDELKDYLRKMNPEDFGRFNP